MSRKMQPIDTGERDKIHKLKTELKTDTGKDKVEFLYSGEKIDRDAYLIGKPIDKLLIEKETADKASANQFLTSTIDLSNKIREDPLFEIKKREIEAKKRLLENPLRLKQLKEMISKSKQGDARSGSDSGDEDLKRKHKKKKDKKKKKKKSKRKESSSSSSSSSESENSDDEKDKKRRRRSTSRERGNYGLINRNEPNRNRNRTRSRSRSRSRSPDRNDPKNKSKLEVEEYKKRINQLKEIRSSGSNRPVGRGGSNVSSKMTEEEKQRRLAEMQSNAKWRDDERSRNVDKYRKDEKKERQLDEISKTDRMKEEASHLFNNMMNDAYSSTEARIKSNMYNIQRNKSSYDSHFARK